MEKLEIGIKKTQEKTVTDKDSAELFGNKGVDVLASPYMIAFMEVTSRNLVAPYLKENETTVGMSFNIDHLASAKIGADIKCDSELVKIEGKKLTFKVKVYTENKIIGEGIHQRYIKDPSRIRKF